MKRDPKTNILQRQNTAGERDNDNPVPGRSQREYDDEQLEFLRAVDNWRQINHGIPTNCEFLQLVRDLGYRRVEPSILRLA